MAEDEDVTSCFQKLEFPSTSASTDLPLTAKKGGVHSTPWDGRRVSISPNDLRKINKTDKCLFEAFAVVLHELSLRTRLGFVKQTCNLVCPNLLEFDKGSDNKYLDDFGVPSLNESLGKIVANKNAIKRNYTFIAKRRGGGFFLIETDLNVKEFFVSTNLPDFDHDALEAIQALLKNFSPKIELSPRKKSINQCNSVRQNADKQTSMKVVDGMNIATVATRSYKQTYTTKMQLGKLLSCMLSEVVDVSKLVVPNDRELEERFHFSGDDWNDKAVRALTLLISNFVPSNTTKANGGGAIYGYHHWLNTIWGDSGNDFWNKLENIPYDMMSNSVTTLCSGCGSVNQFSRPHEKESGVVTKHCNDACSLPSYVILEPSRQLCYQTIISVGNSVPFDLRIAGITQGIVGNDIVRDNKNKDGEEKDEVTKKRGKNKDGDEKDEVTKKRGQNLLQARFEDYCPNPAAIRNQSINLAAIVSVSSTSNVSSVTISNPFDGSSISDSADAGNSVNESTGSATTTTEATTQHDNINASLGSKQPQPSYSLGADDSVARDNIVAASAAGNSHPDPSQRRLPRRTCSQQQNNNTFESSGEVKHEDGGEVASVSGELDNSVNESTGSATTTTEATTQHDNINASLGSKQPQPSYSLGADDSVARDNIVAASAAGNSHPDPSQRRLPRRTRSQQQNNNTFESPEEVNHEDDSEVDSEDDSEVDSEDDCEDDSEVVSVSGELCEVFDIHADKANACYTWSTNPPQYMAKNSLNLSYSITFSDFVEEGRKKGITVVLKSDGKLFKTITALSLLDSVRYGEKCGENNIFRFGDHNVVTPAVLVPSLAGVLYTLFDEPLYKQDKLRCPCNSNCEHFINPFDLNWTRAHMPNECYGKLPPFEQRCALNVEAAWYIDPVTYRLLVNTIARHNIPKQRLPWDVNGCVPILTPNIATLADYFIKAKEVNSDTRKPGHKFCLGWYAGYLDKHCKDRPKELQYLPRNLLIPFLGQGWSEMPYVKKAWKSVWIKKTNATLSAIEMPVVSYNGEVKNLMIKKATSNSSKKRKMDNSKNAGV